MIVLLGVFTPSVLSRWSGPVPGVVLEMHEVDSAISKTLTLKMQILAFVKMQISRRDRCASNLITGWLAGFALT
jgi:hypothetical protein